MPKIWNALTILFTLTIALSASANRWPTYESGRFFGSTVQHGFDIDLDGSNGRSGMLQVRDSRFRYMYVDIDSTLFDFNDPASGCEGPGNFRIYASGEVVLVDWDGDDAIFLTIDPSNTFCTGDAPETVSAWIDGGTGRFEFTEGTAELTLAGDIVLNVAPGPLPFPRHVYTPNGSFELFLE